MTSVKKTDVILCMCLHVKCLIYLSGINQNWKLSTIKIPTIIFHTQPSDTS